LRFFLAFKVQYLQLKTQIIKFGGTMFKSTFLIAILIALFFSSLVYSQPYGWYTQTSGTTSNLNNVKFFDTNTGTVVGQTGKILRTTNSGANWVSQTSGTPNHLFGVFFVNVNTGWATGDIGTILKTTNGGTTWATQNSNVYYQLRSVTFFNVSTGYVVGWYGTILKTTNGGTNWASLVTGTTNNLHGISFANNNTGFVVGWYGTIIKTTNGGNNWATLSSGTSSTLEDVTFFDTQTGLIVGENGLVRRTTNSGTTWTTQNSGTGNWISGITSPHPNFATMVGELGIIRTTTDAGSNWYSQTSNTGNWLNKLDYVDTLHGWGVGDYGTIIHTNYGGWLLPTAPGLSGVSNNASCISLTPTVSWGVVFPPVCTYRVQISLTNTFNTTVIDTSGILYLNYTVPATKLNYSTTYYWRVVPTNQVGVGPWSSIRSFTTTYPSPVAPQLVSPANNVYLGTQIPLFDWDSVANANSFRIRISTDSLFGTSIIDAGGLNVSKYQVAPGILQSNVRYYWRVNASNPCLTSPWSITRNFQIYPIPPAPMLLAPLSNSIITYLNPYFDWDTVTTANNFRFVVSADSLFGTSLLDTSGLNVTNFLLPYGLLQNSVRYYWRVNASSSFATSLWSQTWNFRTNLMATGIGNENGVPDAFKLYDNYPNPFNPVTKIKFDLPLNGMVRLNVYDITGREVVNLINGELKAGSYEFQFNADKLSSGVYFYRMETGSFSDIKRMMLVK
jgi:photosystem II stability/assembly factor-like uncharacterized protein